MGGLVARVCSICWPLVDILECEVTGRELLIKPLIVTLVMGLAVMLAYDKLSDLAEAC